MAICTIAKRGVFGKDYNNFWVYGYDVPALIARVTGLLAQSRPELIWYPATGEMCVNCSSLRAARAQNPVGEIEQLMTELWEQAAAEQRSAMSDEELEVVNAVSAAKSFEDVQRLQDAAI